MGISRNGTNFPRDNFVLKHSNLVEKMGLEPTTSCMPCKRSSQLSYIPGTSAKVKFSLLWTTINF